MTFEGPVIRRSLLLLGLIPALIACSSSATASIGPTEAAPSVAPSHGRPSTPVSPPFATVPPTSAAVTGEVPTALMAKATADLAEQTGLDPTTFKTVRSEQAQWPDGSLGCPVPGFLYTQVVTPGYWIVIEAGGKTYDYRATETGDLRLCTQPNPKPPSG
jgi:hypothetical protein